VHPVVRERYGYACDIGTPRSELRERWPDHDFTHIPEVWWPSDDEPADSVIARASAFRQEMAARPDWSDTLVVSHWGFILCMTGQTVMNGQWLRCDPTEPAPAEIVWRS
jgi:broad specificity phosphatase PhoE